MGSGSSFGLNKNQQSIGEKHSFTGKKNIHPLYPGAVTEMFCQLQKLRFVTFGSAETVTWRQKHQGPVMGA